MFSLIEIGIVFVTITTEDSHPVLLRYLKCCIFYTDSFHICEIRLKVGNNSTFNKYLKPIFS